MQDLTGKTAFVTGAASGIGLAMARAFAAAGMNVMLADIEMDPLMQAVASLGDHGAAVRGVVCDVSDVDSLLSAAEETADAFGHVHILCNNAGVAGGGGVDAIAPETWRWVIDVNVIGVVNGLAAFLPAMRAHKQGGHIVNTASMAGLQAGLGLSPYAASKFAVIAISEGLAMQLAPENIGVSILCPGYVNTRMGESGRNRPERYGPNAAPDPDSPAGQLVAHIAASLKAGLDPSAVAEQVLAAIRANQLYIFTHPEMRGEVDDRFAAIQAALSAAAR